MTARVPVPGDDLRVGDVWLPQVGRRMVVERITLTIRPKYPDAPLLIAQGRTEFANGHVAGDWTQGYYGHDWVVVERTDA